MALNPANWGAKEPDPAAAAAPRPPRGLKTPGRRLWRDVQARYELETHRGAAPAGDVPDR